VDEARHVRTFSFAGVSRTWFRYQPGQFLIIEPVIGGRKVPRSYTISSAPSRPALLEITVKRAAGGLVSNFLHDEMRVGHELHARGPFGRFTCLRDPRDKYLFLAAGSGATPLMSMLRYIVDVAAKVDVVFLQSAATKDDIVFRKELALIGERNPNVHVAITLTGSPAENRWDGLTGRLDNEMLHTIAPDLAERMVFACGPSAFMDKAKQLLAGNGFPLETQFEEESFTPRRARQGEGPGSGVGGSSSRVRFVRSGKAAEIAAGDTILDAAERCGVPIPSSCRQGRCGTCRVTKLSGEVSMPGQEALSADEAASGEVLACIGQPRSDAIEVDL
jgi:ferredoxin-NADP reductase